MSVDLTIDQLVDPEPSLVNTYTPFCAPLAWFLINMRVAFVTSVAVIVTPSTTSAVCAPAFVSVAPTPELPLL